MFLPSLRYRFGFYLSLLFFLGNWGVVVIIGVLFPTLFLHFPCWFCFLKDNVGDVAGESVDQTLHLSDECGCMLVPTENTF